MGTRRGESTKHWYRGIVLIKVIGGGTSRATARLEWSLALRIYTNLKLNSALHQLIVRLYSTTESEYIVLFLLFCLSIQHHNEVRSDEQSILSSMFAILIISQSENVNSIGDMSKQLQCTFYVANATAQYEKRNYKTDVNTKERPKINRNGLAHREK